MRSLIFVALVLFLSADTSFAQPLARDVSRGEHILISTLSGYQQNVTFANLESCDYARRQIINQLIRNDDADAERSTELKQLWTPQFLCLPKNIK